MPYSKATKMLAKELGIEVDTRLLEALETEAAKETETKER